VPKTGDQAKLDTLQEGNKMSTSTKKKFHMVELEERIAPVFFGFPFGDGFSGHHHHHGSSFQSQFQSQSQSQMQSQSVSISISITSSSFAFSSSSASAVAGAGAMGTTGGATAIAFNMM
jgi:hypothetical protein